MISIGIVVDGKRCRPTFVTVLRLGWLRRPALTTPTPIVDADGNPLTAPTPVAWTLTRVVVDTNPRRSRRRQRPADGADRRHGNPVVVIDTVDANIVGRRPPWWAHGVDLDANCGCQRRQRMSVMG
jgi:hypothetical protein